MFTAVKLIIDYISLTQTYMNLQYFMFLDLIHLKELVKCYRIQISIQGKIY